MSKVYLCPKCTAIRGRFGPSGSAPAAREVGRRPRDLGRAATFEVARARGSDGQRCAVSRYCSRGLGTLATAILLGQLVPGIVVVIQVVVLLRHASLTDNLIGLAGVYIVSDIPWASGFFAGSCLPLRAGLTNRCRSTEVVWSRCSGM